MSERKLFPWVRLVSTSTYLAEARRTQGAGVSDLDKLRDAGERKRADADAQSELNRTEKWPRACFHCKGRGCEDCYWSGERWQ